MERKRTDGRVVAASRVTKERFKTGSSVVAADGVGIERVKPNCRVINASCQVQERILTLGGILAGIASVWCWANRLR